MMSQTETKILQLELIENGTANSLIDDSGRIWATGYTSREMLIEAAWEAKSEDYTDIMIGAQSWEIERLVELI